MAVDTVEVLRKVVTETQAWFAATVADVSNEQAHWQPPGVANPIAAVYAHVIVGSDFGLNMMLQERQPLVVSDFDGKAGLSELMPVGEWHDWASRVRMDVDIFRRYADAVYAGWDGYLSTLTSADLDRVIDLSVWEMGTRTLAQFLTMQVQHFSAHCGEIACLKGLQGATGFVAGTPDGRG